MTPNDTLPAGVYRLFWKDGGSSVASVGCDREGWQWLAPANWVSVPCFDWGMIERVELLATANS